MRLKANKVTIFGILALLVGIGMFASSFTAGTGMHSFPVASDRSSFVSGPCIEIKKANGETISYCNHNTITVIALNATRDMWMNGSSGWIGPVKYLELSTDTGALSSSATACPSVVTGNGLDIAAGTTSVVSSSNGNYSVQKQWSATGTQNNIYKVCLGNTSVSTMSNKLFAYGWLNLSEGAPINLGSGDQLTVTYYIAAT